MYSGLCDVLSVCGRFINKHTHEFTHREIEIHIDKKQREREWKYIYIINEPKWNTLCIETMFPCVDIQLEWISVNVGGCGFGWWDWVCE